MPESARRNADDPAPRGDPERNPDPRAGGWADVREAVIINCQAVALAAAEVAARPGDPHAGDMLELTLRVLEHLGVIAGRCTVDETVIEAVRERAYAEGYDACKAERHRMKVVGGRDR